MNAYIQLRLKACPFFSGLPSDELRRLAGTAFLRELRKGEILFREGQPCSAVYCLDAGSIHLIRGGIRGTEAVIRTIRPGELFAEAGLFEKRLYPVTARATVPSRVIGLLRNDLLGLLSVPSFREAFFALLMRRLRYLTDRVEQLMVEDVESRLARFLWEHRSPEGRVTVEMKKKDVAAAIAATPETLSRLLRRLARRRLLSWRGQTLIVAPSFWERHLFQS